MANLWQGARKDESRLTPQGLPAFECLTAIRRDPWPRDFSGESPEGLAEFR